MPDAVPEPNPETGAWRRWTPAAAPVIARAAGVRWPPTTDFSGRPLPPIPGLTALVSGIGTCIALSRPGGSLAPALRAAVLAAIGADIEAAVGDLRAAGLALFWRLDPAPGVAGRLAALAIDRRPG